MLTLGKTLKLLKQYASDDFDADFFDELDADNGASRLAKMIIEECTDVNLFVGKAVNAVHRDSSLSFDLSMRMNLIDQMAETLKALDRQVTVTYY